MAIAVDGTIGAVMSTYTLGDEHGWVSGLVAERLLEPGTHDIDLYVVSGQGADRSLRPVATR